MHIISKFALPLISSLALAQSATVKVTSFLYTGAHSTGAELCGKVMGGSGTEIVQVTVDPNSKTPAQYTTQAADDGSFCLVVSTLTGEASAAIRGQPHIGVVEVTYATIR